MVQQFVDLGSGTTVVLFHNKIVGTFGYDVVVESSSQRVPPAAGHLVATFVRISLEQSVQPCVHEKKLDFEQADNEITRSAGLISTTLSNQSSHSPTKEPWRRAGQPWNRPW